MKKWSLLILVGYLFLLSGCMAIATGIAGEAGSSKWLSGKLSQEVNAPFDQVIEAGNMALRRLSFDITKQTVKDEVAQIKARYTDGRAVWIDVHKLSSSSSRLEVRVGMTGDRESARKILDQILKYL